MLTARLDVSAVPPQGGYVAKQCPVRPQWDVLRPCEPLPVSDAVRRRMEQGNRFEAEVFAELAALHPDAVVIDRGGPDDRADRDQRTLAAMRAGAPVIIGGRLPVDELGRRVGEPDVLVAAAGGGYHPVDVKHHATLLRPTSERRGLEARLSPVSAPWWHDARVGADLVARKHKDDLLQLAHYRRMLEACGFAAVDGVNLGGIIGTGILVEGLTGGHGRGRAAEAAARAATDATANAAAADATQNGTGNATATENGNGELAPPAVEAVDGLVVTWYDLDAPIWTTPSASEGRKVRSTMAVYDFEFGFRLDIIETARRHRDDPGVEPLVVPVRIGECASCPWWVHCHDVLEAADDVSLLPRIGWNQWRRHRDCGVTSMAELASLDWHTAHLCDRGVDLRMLFDAIAAEPDDRRIADVLDATWRAQVQRLADYGVVTVADARRLDGRVATYTGVNVGGLARSIDLARAYLADEPVLLRRGVTDVEVPRGDIEVDLDLESTEQGVYLWGALVTDPGATGLAPEGYRAFVRWEPLIPAVEVALAEELWQWLAGLRAASHEAGARFRVYCFNERAEAGELRRLAASPLVTFDGFAAAVDDLVASPDWVDLLAVADAHLVTGGSKGLKKLAPLAGFAWEDADAGGEQSMHWHDLAVDDADPAVRDANRARILTYNRNDVEATLALRDWLQSAGPALPRIDDTDAAYGWDDSH